ncbi:MAG: tetratricopeptide repeat protein [Planctomycetaceae bacterium]|nr:tetratricopeptide repeat protein [Planctomycetaceae bacterium]
MAEDQGDRETAESLYRDAFRLDPGGPAFPELVYGKYLSPDTDWGMVETAESFSARNCPAREQLHFSLGQIYDKVRDYDRAFGWFMSGNELSRWSRGI